MKSILLMTFFLSALPAYLLAEDLIIIDELVELSFEPKHSSVFVSTSDGQLRKFPALVIPIGESGKSLNRKTYLIGALLSKLSATPVTMSIAAVGVNGEESNTPVKEIHISPNHNISAAVLREEVKRQRDKNSEIKSDLDKEILNLKQLRVDAAKMSDIGKIIEIEEETRQLRDANQALGRDIEILKAALSEVKELSEPARFERRKVLLTEQLSEMAKAALEVEQSASTRKRSTVSDLDKKLALIDSTRFDDLEELEKEYQNITGDELPVDSSEYLNLKEG